jgi:hypothetical protein
LHAPSLWHAPGGAHTTGLPAVHAPLWQLSACVQAFPSSHAAPFILLGYEQTPLTGLQVPASWHCPGAAHATGLLPMQAPLWQASLCVHAFPSSQEEPSA